MRGPTIEDAVTVKFANPAQRAKREQEKGEEEPVFVQGWGSQGSVH